MQIVSLGDNLHAMSNQIFWKKYEKYFKMSSAEILTQYAKIYNIVWYIPNDSLVEFYVVIDDDSVFLMFVFCCCFLLFLGVFFVVFFLSFPKKNIGDGIYKRASHCMWIFSLFIEKIMT